MSWAIIPSDDYLRCYEWYEKKRPRELRACLDNLDTYLEALKAGARSRQRMFGFVHPEPGGVLAIDQKGGGKNLQQTRLYVFPDDVARELHLLTIGDKQSQRDDIIKCKHQVGNLESKNTSKHAQETIQHGKRDGPRFGEGQPIRKGYRK